MPKPISTKAAASSTAPNTVTGYLAAAPVSIRPALRKLRKTIRAAAPGATEGLSYGILGFKHHGKLLVYLGYWKTHLALYGLMASFLDAHAPALRAYQVSKGTIRFPVDEPIPYRLVTKAVKARAAQLALGRPPR